MQATAKHLGSVYRPWSGDLQQTTKLIPKNITGAKGAWNLNPSLTASQNMFSVLIWSNTL